MIYCGTIVKIQFGTLDSVLRTSVLKCFYFSLFLHVLWLICLYHFYVSFQVNLLFIWLRKYIFSISDFSNFGENLFVKAREHFTFQWYMIGAYLKKFLQVCKFLYIIAWELHSRSLFTLTYIKVSYTFLFDSFNLPFAKLDSHLIK